MSKLVCHKSHMQFLVCKVLNVQQVGDSCTIKAKQLNEHNADKHVYNTPEDIDFLYSLVILYDMED